MILLWTGRARVYFNNWAEAPLYWSVDDGHPDGEVKCSRVRIEYTGCETVVEPDCKASPRAWLSFPWATVYRENGEVLITAPVSPPPPTGEWGWW